MKKLMYKNYIDLWRHKSAINVFCVVFASIIS